MWVTITGTLETIIIIIIILEFQQNWLKRRTQEMNLMEQYLMRVLHHLAVNSFNLLLCLQWQ